MILSAVAVMQLHRALAALDVRVVEMSTVPRTGRPVAVIDRDVDLNGRARRLVLSDGDDWQLSGGDPLGREGERVVQAQYPAGAV